MKSLVFIYIGIIWCVSFNAQTDKRVNWEDDIDFLASELPKRHCDFFTVKDKSFFLSELEKIKQNSTDLSDFEVAVKLQQLVASFGDSHTSLNVWQFVEKDKVLPLHLYWFSDGLYVLHTTPENVEILGHQLLFVNGISLKTITDSLSTLITNDNPSIGKKSLPKIIPFVQVLEYFDFVNEDEVELVVKDLNGVERHHLIRPAEMNRSNRKMVLPDSLALCYRNERAFFVDSYLAAFKVYYLQYNRCWSKELELQHGNSQKAQGMPSFNDYEQKVFHTIVNNPVEKVVFDMRFNGGGNSSQGTEFIKKYTQLLETHPRIKTYVIIGRDTYSSAVLNALDFRRLTNAVFVGEETSGKPNHFGEVRSFQLPSSGMRVGYSTKYFKRTDGDVNSFVPDVILEPDFADFINGNDPAFEWIKTN